ncbi:hypothetical protein HGP28_02765 [Vibrio sp. SM6]|uniref:Metalloprotease StcE beta-sandwich domain-containing protein n=1 Tax=Vibrio agarilyticus TaxID=2726741 RepID=A0A7X8TN46_9VIBR|nr:Ig-like domain-containing protein [Vibrio agarilyticus]NLS11811.1 hypothetical protein [Vibrio agarilyticus]
MNYNFYFRHSIIATSLALLLGCGGGSDGNSAPSTSEPQPNAAILAIDGFNVVRPNIATTVDLQPYVRGENLRLTDIYAKNDVANCGTPVIKDLALEINTFGAAYCTYAYTITDGHSEHSANLSVLASEADSPLLTPLSEQAVIGDGVMTFDLPSLLSGEWKSTYSVNVDSVVVQGMDDNLGSVTATGNTLTFTPPEYSGWNRIVYTLTDSAAPGADLMGVIYVTVSDDTNLPPSIRAPFYEYNTDTTIIDVSTTPNELKCSSGTGGLCDFKPLLNTSNFIQMTTYNGNWVKDIALPEDPAYDGKLFQLVHKAAYNSHVYSGDDTTGRYLALSYNGLSQTFTNIAGKWYLKPSPTIEAATEVTVDLATLNGLDIIDPEGQTWQLVDVQSYTSTVTPTEPDDINNTRFNFSATNAGVHIVQYIVADHYGGYASGFIKMNVSARGGEATWVDVDGFTAPLTFDEAGALGLATKDIWDEPVNNTIAGFNDAAADNYCSSVGIIPTLTDIQLLRDGNLAGGVLTGDLADWPLQQPYLVKDGSRYKGFRLDSAIVTDYEPYAPYYATCIEARIMKAEFPTYTAVANGEPHEVAIVSMPYANTFSTETVAGTLIAGEVTLDKGTTDGGVTPLYGSTTVVGTHRFALINNSDEFSRLISPTIEYVGDVTTADFDSVSIVANYEHHDGVAQNKISLVVKDFFGNVVKNALVDVEVVEADPDRSVTVEFIPANRRTDAEGKLQLNVTNTAREIVTFKVQYNHRADGVQKEQSRDLLFGPDRFPCGISGGGFNCLPTLDSKSMPGFLYLAPPERAFMNRIYYGSTANGYHYSSTSSPSSPYYDSLPGFYSPRFTKDEAHAWCARNNSMQTLQRTNWRMATVAEYDKLYGEFGKMTNARGWFTAMTFWANDLTGTINLRTGEHGSAAPKYGSVSCVSEAE